MEAQWIADRTALRCLSRQHPAWTHTELATCLGRSVSWVKKWLKRLQEAPPDDLTILHSHSRARRTPPPPPDRRIVQKIAEIRENPPENLQRVPGPRAILYYLHRDASEAPRPSSLSRAPHARCGKFCASWATSWTPPSANESRWNCVIPSKRCRWISKTPPRSPPIPTASASTWWKCSTSSMLGPRSCSARRLMRISMRKPHWRRWCISCANTACQPCSPLITIPGFGRQ
jgi:hypothetical protein